MPLSKSNIRSRMLACWALACSRAYLFAISASVRFRGPYCCTDSIESTQPQLVIHHDSLLRILLLNVTRGPQRQLSRAGATETTLFIWESRWATSEDCLRPRD